MCAEERFMDRMWVFYFAGAYVLRSIPFGQIISRRVASIDITTRGSGNIGATNVARELGMKWGILTLLLDLLKGLVPVLCRHVARPGGGSAWFPAAHLLSGSVPWLDINFLVSQNFMGEKGWQRRWAFILSYGHYSLFCH